ncbi:MAG: hypothetical protein U5L96_19985 [Owenweeksia sp.]|nr:hypothetical protein [Owenweeksia sp.]
MKKVYTLLSVMLVSTALFAQPSYYVLPTPDAGFNPGNLNGDAEQPNEPGWNQIMATTSTDMWSSAQSIPFTFQFNGTTQSSFVISNTGVLTFSPSPGTAPSATNLALPTTTIPDNSVCVWGLDLTGGNDNIRTKVFGTSPNRQMWIQFTSASAPELTGSFAMGLLVYRTRRNH